MASGQGDVDPPTTTDNDNYSAGAGLCGSTPHVKQFNYQHSTAAAVRRLPLARHRPVDHIGHDRRQLRSSGLQPVQQQQPCEVDPSASTVPSIVTPTVECFNQQQHCHHQQQQQPFVAHLCDLSASTVPSTEQQHCHHQQQRRCECEFCHLSTPAAITPTDHHHATPVTPPRLTPPQLACPDTAAATHQNQLQPPQQQPPTLPFQTQPQDVMSFGGGGGYAAPAPWAATAQHQQQQLQMHQDAVAVAEAVAAEAEAARIPFQHRQFEYAYRYGAEEEAASTAAAAAAAAVDEEMEDTPLVRGLRERIRTLEAELDLALGEEEGGTAGTGRRGRPADGRSHCRLCGAPRVDEDGDQDDEDGRRRQRGAKRRRRQGRRVSNERDRDHEIDVDDENECDYVSAPLIPPIGAATTTAEGSAAGGTKGRGGGQRRPRPKLPTSSAAAAAATNALGAEGDRPKIIVDGRKHRHDATFEANCNLLREFKAKYGHCDASRKVKEHGKAGQFVFKQREHYKKYLLGKQSPLDPYRIGILEGIGLKWNHDKNGVWSRRYDELKRFQEMYGHCCVPAVVNARWRQRPPLPGDDENDCPGGEDGRDRDSNQFNLDRLAKWAEYQRKELQWMAEWERENGRSMTEDDRKVKNQGKGGKIRLTEERIDLLRALGCHWLNSSDKEDDDDEEYEYLERPDPSQLAPPQPEVEGDDENENGGRHEEDDAIAVPVGDVADDANEADASEMEAALGEQDVVTPIGASGLTMSKTGGRRKSAWTWYRRFEVLRECNNARTSDRRGGSFVIPAGLNWWVDAQRRLHNAIKDGTIECDAVFETRMCLLADIGCVSNDDK